MSYPATMVRIVPPTDGNMVDADDAVAAPRGCRRRAASRRGGLLLRDAFSHLVPLLHPALNLGLDLDTLTAASGRSVWWKCPVASDHVWPAQVGNVTRWQFRCPFCAGQRVSAETNALSTLYPRVAAQWHPDRNGELTPDDVTAGSNRSVWWCCPGGPDHVWQVSICARTSRGNGCPYCANKLLSQTNSLAARYPRVAAQWHYERNGDLTPDDVVYGSGRAVWWSCPVAEDHEWQVRVVQRTTMGTGCPCCANQKVSRTNALDALFPAVAAQLHPDRNYGISADKVIAGSNKPMWWICPEGEDHVWRCPPVSRTYDGTGCPVCAGQRVSSANALSALFPAVAAQWHPERNDGVQPDQVAARSNKPAWWQCTADLGHVWQTAPTNRTRGRTGCPYCANKKVSPTNNLAARHPQIAAQFDPALNAGRTADQIVAVSETPAIWRCPAGEDHIWTAPVRSRTTSDPGCPACAGRQLSRTNSLAALFPDLVGQWHPRRNGAVAPDTVIGTSSTVTVWWLCPAGDDHEWQTVVRTRTVGGHGCPCCANQKVSRSNRLSVLHPEVAAQWHTTLNGQRTPDQIVAGSREAVWWTCPEGPDHVWRTSVGKRTKLRTGCPSCAGVQVSVTNSLQTLRPDIAAQLDPDGNDGLTADKVVARSSRVLAWQCPAGPDHRWRTTVYARTVTGSGCPCCAGQQLAASNSLNARFPDVASEFDPALNGGRTAAQILGGTHERFTWRCRVDPAHQWVTSVANRTSGAGHGCPDCAVSGFRPALPAYLYLLRRRHDGREERKVGITNVPTARLGKLGRLGWQLIEISDQMDGSRALGVEQAFLRGLLRAGLRRTRSSPVADRQDGYTETWSYDALPIDSLGDVYRAGGLP